METTSSLIFRRATRQDLPQIVSLLSDDELGRTREAAPDGSLAAYEEAWTLMDQDAANWILIAAVGQEVLGVLQLTLIAGLSRSGTRRAQIEGVRVKSTTRGQAIGRELMTYAIDIAKEHKCGLIQLTTDKRRTDAKRFYESMGFSATHEGMKLDVAPSGA